MTKKKFDEVAFMFNELDAVEENIDTIRDIMLSAPDDASITAGGVTYTIHNATDTQILLEAVLNRLENRQKELRAWIAEV